PTSRRALCWRSMSTSPATSSPSGRRRWRMRSLIGWRATHGRRSMAVAKAERPRRSGEFELIRRYFRPLAGTAALDLTDDAALLQAAPGRDLILTTDAIVEGVHFPEGEAPAFVAKRLIRVNLSDL